MHADIHACIYSYPALRININADTESVEKRLFFENRVTTISESVNANVGTQFCMDFTTYIRVHWLQIQWTLWFQHVHMQNNTSDKFNPFVVEMSVDTLLATIDISTGNDTVESLSSFPFTIVSGTRRVQVSNYYGTLRQWLVCIITVYRLKLWRSVEEENASLIWESASMNQ